MNDALGRLLSEWSAATGTTVETWALPRHDLAPEAAETIMATLRQVLADISSYGGAERVSVAITSDVRGVHVTLSTQSAGEIRHDTDRLRARFTRLGGAMSVNHVNGEGITLSAILPTP